MLRLTHYIEPVKGPRPPTTKNLLRLLLIELIKAMLKELIKASLSIAILDLYLGNLEEGLNRYSAHNLQCLDS